MQTLETVFSELREIMLRASQGMDLTQDDPGNLVLKTPWNEPGKKQPAWFGAIQLKKHYVACHLMPLHSLPVLQKELSPMLKMRMHGKSCFNFKDVEPDLLEDLERLIVQCAHAYALPVIAQPH